jgi:hypothetical protein
MTTWMKLEDGTWGIRVENGDYPEHEVGSVRVVKTKAGKTSRVVVGEHIRHWIVGPRRWVDIYRIDDEKTKAQAVRDKVVHGRTRNF